MLRHLLLEAGLVVRHQPAERRLAGAGPVGGDDAVVGGFRAGDVRAEGAEVWGVSAEWLVPVVDGEDDGEPGRRGGPVTREEG